MRKTIESRTYVHTKEQQKVRCRAVFLQQYRDYARFFSFVFLWSCQLTKKPTTHWDFTIRKIYHKKKCSEGTMQRAGCSPYLTNPALLPGQQGIMIFSTGRRELKNRKQWTRLKGSACRVCRQRAQRSHLGKCKCESSFYHTLLWNAFWSTSLYHLNGNIIHIILLLKSPWRL